VAATAVALGYYTRLAMFLSWYPVISLHDRNPIILHNGDGVLRLLLFWGMFLPLGGPLVLGFGALSGRLAAWSPRAQWP
jgi:hypothetical protein